MGGLLVSRLSDLVLQARDGVSRKNRFKSKSIVMQTTNNLSEKYIIIHILRGDLLSLNENVIFWRFFIIFNILNVSVG